MPRLIDPTIEVKLQQVIFPDLKKGRQDFDLPHTKAVVFWMKKLLVNLPQINSKVLITAAYAHDWGYIGLFDGVNSDDIDMIHKMKPLHMERGSKLITVLIEKELSPYFSSEEKERVAHLVLMHDRIEDLTQEDEILLMEADTLGMLDTDRVKPTFTKEDNDVFIQREIKGRRLPKFFHKQAKIMAATLVQKRLNFYLDV